MEHTLLTVSSVYALVVLCIVTTVFIIASWRDDNSIMDIAYGPTFAIAAWCTMLLTSTTNLGIIIASVITLWALRLGTRIFRKNKGRPEDARYAAWRTAWREHGALYFVIRSYLQIYILQGSIIVLVAVPFLVSLTTHTLNTAFAICGIALSLFGLGFETLADRQLDQFLREKKLGQTMSPIITTGLFRYSRRPNYFGETLVWWGLALAAFGSSSAWIVFVSPLLITYIVTRITGPMLEAIFLREYNNEYQAYMKKTSYFIPLPPRSEQV